MKINWKHKFTSRKFWAAVTGVIVALLAVFNVDDLTSEKVVTLVAAIGLLAAYIVVKDLLIQIEVMKSF